MVGRESSIEILREWKELREQSSQESSEVYQKVFESLVHLVRRGWDTSTYQERSRVESSLRALEKLRE